MQRGLSRSSSKDRARETSRVCLNRRTCQAVGPLPGPRAVSKPKPASTASTGDSSKLKERVIHKHTVPGTSGTVEVIVKTQSQAGDAPKDRPGNVPWGEMLQRRPAAADDPKSAFSQFDPLRTVHFIADELATKFEVFDDPAVKQLVSDMQVALKRVPREVSSISREDLSLIRREIKSAMRKDATPKTKESRGSQTAIDSKQEMLEAEIVQRTFETSLANLESTCRNLESTCVSLRKEKEELRSSLAAESKKSEELRRAFESQRQKNEVLSADHSALRERAAHLDANLSQMSRESKKVIAKLREENFGLAREVSDVKSELSAAVFEKEKLAVAVSARDAQLAQMRAEIDAIQALVQEQFAKVARDDRKSQPLCSSRSGSGDSPPAWNTQMLSSIRDSSPPIKEASAEVQDLFRNIIEEKALRGDVPDSLNVDRKNEPASQSFKELPTYCSDEERPKSDDGVFDRMVDLKCEEDIDELLERVKRLASERVGKAGASD